MQVLVIGLGFVGTALCQHLAEHGHTVITVNRTDLESETHYQLDARCAELRRVFYNHRFDVVIHLAAEVIGVPPVEVDHDYAMTQNMSSLMNAYTMALECKVAKFIFASTTATKGETLSAYAYSKLVGEKLLRITDQRIMRTTSVRFANLYGAGQSAACKHESLINKVVRLALGGNKITMYNGAAKRDYLYITDAVQALALIATTDDNKLVYEVGSGVLTSTLSAIQLIKAKAGMLDSEVLATQGRPGDVASTSLDLTNLKELYSHLGKKWVPIPLELGIDKLLEAT
mgnify:CR=1 FL=1